MPGPRKRYRFGEFTLSPTERLLTRTGRELPLIPRYFDLLVYLVEHRHEAVHRREILDAVWGDVVVSDGALSQAVRILRRTLGDDSKGPVFIRTIPRHGYRFVHPEVAEATDERPMAAAHPAAPAAETIPAIPPPAGEERRGSPDRIERELQSLLSPRPAKGQAEDEVRRQAAESLHALGTAEALRRLDRRPGHAVARAYLRETRWDVPGAGPVPLWGRPGATTAAGRLIALRIRRVVRLAGKRWVAAMGGGVAIGVIAGLIGGLALRFGPGSRADSTVLFALPFVGAVIGGVGAAGVGAGLAAAEAVVRSARGAALVLGGALGGGAIGALAHLLGSWVLEGLFGRDLSPLAGGFEGIVLGGAVGLGYALATPTLEGGMATPRGAARVRTTAVSGLFCGAAAVLLAATGSYLGAMSLDFMARSFPGSQVGLDPLARLLGEASPGLRTRLVISAFEGLMFGIGVIFGLTRRPR